MRPKRIEPEQRPAAAIEGLRPFTAKQGQHLAFIETRIEHAEVREPLQDGVTIVSSEP
jgi:hypothetical protein